WSGDKRPPRAAASRRCRRHRDVLARRKNRRVGNGNLRKGECNGENSGKATRPEAGDGRSASVTLASGTNQQRHAAGPLAADRTGAELASASIPHRPALLAHDAAPELRPFCVSQCNRHHRAAHQRVVCFGCDFYHPGDESSAPRHDQSFQRADAQGLGTSRPVEQNGAVPEFEPEAAELIENLCLLPVEFVAVFAAPKRIGLKSNGQYTGSWLRFASDSATR